LPGARILRFDETGVHESVFDDLEHVTLTRSFLADPERFLRKL
jgi:predicted ATPase